jgi:hypothetical protein
VKMHEARAKIKEIGIVAAIRVASREDAIFAAEAVFEGGVPVVEIALTLDGATTVISQLVKDNPQLVVGAGSVLNEKVAQTCLDAGAHFHHQRPAACSLGGSGQEKRDRRISRRSHTHGSHQRMGSRLRFRQSGALRGDWRGSLHSIAS